MKEEDLTHAQAPQAVGAAGVVRKHARASFVLDVSAPPSLGV